MFPASLPKTIVLLAISSAVVGYVLWTVSTSSVKNPSHKKCRDDKECDGESKKQNP